MMAAFSSKLSTLLFIIFLAPLLIVSLNNNAFADAMYYADLDFSLIMPPAVVNKFGYGGPWANSETPPPIEIGNAITVQNKANVTIFQVNTAPAPPEWPEPGWDVSKIRNGRKVDNVSVLGLTEPEGYSYAESKGVLHYRLGNLSNAVFNAIFFFGFNSNLETKIDDPWYDFAQARFDISIKSKPEKFGAWSSDYEYSESISGNDELSVWISTPVTVPLLPDSITLFEIQYSVNGEAISFLPIPPPPDQPPPIDKPDPVPVPEPSTCLLTQIGIGLLWYTFSRSRRKA